MARQKEETLDMVNVIIPEAKKQLDAYVQREWHKPTLRTLYYILLDEVVPGTEYGYKNSALQSLPQRRLGRFQRMHLPIQQESLQQTFALWTNT